MNLSPTVVCRQQDSEHHCAGHQSCWRRCRGAVSTGLHSNSTACCRKVREFTFTPCGFVWSLKKRMGCVDKYLYGDKKKGCCADAFVFLSYDFVDIATPFSISFQFYPTTLLLLFCLCIFCAEGNRWSSIVKRKSKLLTMT